MSIAGTNDAAVLSSAVVALDETDAALKTSGTLTISDVDNPAQFVAQANVHGAHGDFAIDANGAWTYTANPAFDSLNVGQSVSDTFSVSAVDGTATSVQVTINGTNDAPVVNDDALLAVQGKALSFSASDLLKNDTDVDSPSVTIQSVTKQPGHGTLAQAADGTYTYTPDAGYSGADIFTYVATDGSAQSNEATVSINVQADSDGDGVTDVVEAATSNGGDANSDGIQDFLQSNVASVQAGNSGAFVTLVSADGTSLSNLGVDANPPMEGDGAPVGVGFPFGSLHFELNGVDPGGTASVTVLVPNAVDVNAVYKFGGEPGNATDHWYSFNYDAATNTGATIDGSAVTLNFVDGERGDADLLANGVINDGFTLAHGGPVISGTSAPRATINDTATTHPFSGVTITNPDGSVNSLGFITVDVQVKGPGDGVLTGSSFTSKGGGLYEYIGSASDATTAIHTLVFNPTDNHAPAGQIEATKFTITAGNGYATSTDTTSAVRVYSVNDAPVISGLGSSLSGNEYTVQRPFQTISVSDPDPGTTITATVSVDDWQKGSFTTYGNILVADSLFTKNADHSWSVSGSVAAVQNALRGLFFDPTDGRLVAGQAETDHFTVTVSDGIAAPIVDHSQSVIVNFSGALLLDSASHAGAAYEISSGFSINSAGGVDFNGDGYDDVFAFVPDGDLKTTVFVHGGMNGISNVAYRGSASIDAVHVVVAGSPDATGSPEILFSNPNAIPYGFDYPGTFSTTHYDAYKGDASLYRIHNEQPSIAPQVTTFVSGEVSWQPAPINQWGYFGNEQNMLGQSVAINGDINGDGLNDVVIESASTTVGRDGVVSIIFDADAGMQSLLDSTQKFLNVDAMGGATGFTILGENTLDYFAVGTPSYVPGNGFSSLAVGDLNGDGYADVVVGDELHKSLSLNFWGGPDGNVTVIWGGPGHASVDLANLDAGAGVEIDGPVAGAQFGHKVAVVGDVNGDGVSDLAVTTNIIFGAATTNPLAYVFFSSASKLSSLDTGNFAPGPQTGIAIYGAFDPTFTISATAIAGVGDVNGDGYADFAIGFDLLPGGSGDYVSRDYIIYGSASGGSVDLNHLLPSQGFIIEGPIFHGVHENLGAAGDVNGDGYGDILAGSGVIFGGNYTNSVTRQGTASDDVLTGTSGADVMVGGTGDDVLVGKGGADAMHGGQGDDILAISNANFRLLDGGTGYDTVRLDGSGWNLNLASIPNARLSGIEAFDLTGSGNNTLAVSALEVVNLSDSSNTLRVEGNAGDSVNTTDTGWTYAGRIHDDSFTHDDQTTYARYVKGNAVLEVDTDINRSGIHANNTAPTANPDTNSAQEDVTLMPTGNVLTNDSDAHWMSVVNAGTLSGSYGTLTLADNGDYTYVLNNGSSVVQALAGGQHATDLFTYQVTDGQDTRSSTLTIDVLGTNDPAVVSSANVALAETNSPLSTSGVLTISDIDNPAVFVAQNIVSGTHGHFSIDSSGQWGFTANSAFDSLNAGQSVSDTYTVKAFDGTLTSVTVTINGSNDPAVMSRADVSIDEVNVLVGAAGTLTISDVDNPAQFVPMTNVHAHFGTFSINSAGQWGYFSDSAFDSLNVGDHRSDTFAVSAADGTTTSVKVTINGTNDPAVMSSADVQLLQTNVPDTASGMLTISDPDNPALFVAQAHTTGAHGAFSIDSAGHWSFAANASYATLNSGESVSDTYSVSAVDGTTTTVKVTILGMNDPATFTGVSTGSVTEAGVYAGTSTATGTLIASDVDNPPGFQAQTFMPSAFGHYSIDAGGHWTYYLDDTNTAVNHLNQGQTLVDHLAVTTSDSTTTNIDITINGTDDAPVVTPQTASATEGGSAVVINALATASDVDNAVLSFGGVLGSLPAGVTFDSATNTFTLNPSDAAYYNLAAGQHATATVNYLVSDGLVSTTASASFDITGTGAHVNHAPVYVGGLTSQMITEGAALSFSVPQGAFSDSDVGDTLTYSATRSDGSALPVWLTFDTATQTFSGTPGNSDIGNIAVSVTATDSHGATAAEIFNLNVAAAATAPIATDDTFLLPWNYSPITFEYNSLKSWNPGSGYHSGIFTNDGLAFTSDKSLLPAGSDERYQPNYVTGPSIYTDVGADHSNALTSWGYGNIWDSDPLDVSTMPLEMTRVDHGTFSLGSASITGRSYSSDDNATAVFHETVSGYLNGILVAQETFDAADYSSVLHQMSTVNLAAPGFANVDRVEFKMTAAFDVNTWQDVAIQQIDNVGPIPVAQVLNVLANDTDPNPGGQLVVNSYDHTTALGAAVTVSTHGDVAYDPSGSAAYKALSAGQAGTDSFTYDVIDPATHAVSNRATVVLNVYGVNADATISAMTPGSDAGQAIDGVTPPYASISGALSFSDVNLLDAHSVNVVTPPMANGYLFATLVSDSTGTGTGGEIDWTYGVDPTFLQSLNQGEVLTDTFTIQLSDGISTISKEVTVTLVGSNDAPVGILDTASVVEAGVFVQGSPVATGTVLANDTDPDNGTVLHVAVADTGDRTGVYGTLHLNADGSYTYSINNGSAAVQALAPGQVVHDVFNYTPVDELGLAGNATQIDVSVTGNNDAPAAIVLPASLENASVTLSASQLLSGGNLAWNPAMSISGVAVDPSLGAVADNHDGTWTYTPLAYYKGPVSLSYTATDGVHSASATATLSITPVSETPNTPVLSAPASVDAATSFDVTFNVSGPDSTETLTPIVSVTGGMLASLTVTGGVADAHITPTAGAGGTVHVSAYVQSQDGNAAPADSATASADIALDSALQLLNLSLLAPGGASYTSAPGGAVSYGVLTHFAITGTGTSVFDPNTHLTDNLAGFSSFTGGAGVNYGDAGSAFDLYTPVTSVDGGAHGLLSFGVNSLIGPSAFSSRVDASVDLFSGTATSSYGVTQIANIDSVLASGILHATSAGDAGAYRGTGFYSGLLNSTGELVGLNGATYAAGETLQGGSVSYSHASGAISARIYDPSAPGQNIYGSVTDANTYYQDNLQNVLNIQGSDFKDTIRGNSYNNLIDGGKGVDTLWGGGGSDTFVYHNLADGGGVKTGDLIKDFKIAPISQGGDILDIRDLFAGYTAPDLSSYTNLLSYVRIAQGVLPNQSLNDSTVQVDPTGSGFWTALATLSGVAYHTYNLHDLWLNQEILVS